MAKRRAGALSQPQVAGNQARSWSQTPTNKPWRRNLPFGSEGEPTALSASECALRSPYPLVALEGSTGLQNVLLCVTARRQFDSRISTQKVC